MKNWLLVFNRARSGRFVLTQVVALCVAFLIASVYLHTTLQEKLSQSHGQAGSQQGVLAEKQKDLADIQHHVAKFRLLKQQGLIGTADREGWVEQLLASRKQLGLPDTLTYTLKPPAPISAIASPDQNAAPAEAGPDTALAHDLEITMLKIHEEEILLLLHDFKEKVRGRFRVQTCRFSEPKPDGLSAQCTLRFFGLPEDIKPPEAGA